MRILAASDLHIANARTEDMQISNLAYYIDKYHPDVLVISGDVYENYMPTNFYPLNTLGIPVVFCLGNHEFVYRTVSETLKHYEQQQKYFDNVHCLDIKHYVDIKGVRFVGNVLWYDGSMSTLPDKDYYLNNISTSWLDASIKEFKPVEEHKKCVQHIKDSLKNYEGKSVLVTHTCPNSLLNMFCREDPMSIYNIYSGVNDLFGTHGIYPTWAICGHTHREVDFDYEDNQGHLVHCINVGNDYGQCKVRIIEMED